MRRREVDDESASEACPSGEAAVLRSVQQAAVARALLDDADADRYLSLVGALEAPRSGGRRRPDAAEAPSRSDRFIAPALTVLAALAAVERHDGPALVPDAWTPAGRSNDRDHLVVSGAAVAHRRFGVPLERAAQLAGASRDDLQAAIAALDA